MRFGGHETFTIREGWLNKALTLCDQDSKLLWEDEAGDYLGVGSNMVKSIRYWLTATGLVSLDKTLTPLAKLILKYDPHFYSKGTWWLLHDSLVRDKNQAYTWNWFFNCYIVNTFDKNQLLLSLKEYLSLNDNRKPADTTLNKDVGVFLNTYSTTIPSDKSDPEDGNESGFKDLKLLTFFKDTGNYKLNRSMKKIPPHIFCIIIKNTFDILDKEEASFSEIFQMSNSPAKIMCLTQEDFFEMTQNAVEKLGSSIIDIKGLAGSKNLKIGNFSTIELLTEFYKSENLIWKKVA